MPFDRGTHVVPNNIALNWGTGGLTGRGDLEPELPIRSDSAYCQITLALYKSLTYLLTLALVFLLTYGIHLFCGGAVRGQERGLRPHKHCLNGPQFIER